ncbi:hypothetical protein H1R20_g12946, partial [Candolleomyces eurysporus]
MPKDQPGNAGFKSRSSDPYPSLFSTQDGRIGVLRAGPSSRTEPVAPRLPASQQQSVEGIRGSQLSSFHPPDAHLGESSAFTRSSSSGCQWTQWPLTTHSNFSLCPVESTPPSQQALTASQPPQALVASMGDAAPPLLPFEKPGEWGGNPVANSSGATSLVHFGYTQVPLSHPPDVPVLSSSSAWIVHDHGAITTENVTEPPLPLLQYPYPQLPTFNPFGAVSDPPSANSWEETHQLSVYYDITIESANPQLPAAPTTDFLPQISSQWTAKDLELLFNLPHLETPHVASIDDLSLGLLQGSLMAANAPRAWPPPSHSSSRSVPDSMLPVDNSKYHNPQPQRESYIVDPSHSTVVSTSAREDLRSVADHWEQNNQYRAYPGIALERSIPPAQPLPETRSPHRLSPQMPGKPLLPNLQRQSSPFLFCPEPVHVVEAHESLPPDSSVDVARSSRSFLRNAQNFRMGDLNHIDAPNATHVTKTHVTNNTVVTSGSGNGWKILLKHTAPNALHDSGARFDAPKCDEDTRIEVTDEIMGFIKDRRHPQRLLCMTGAAGSGKSALQQTIAERCAKGNILGAAYFISVADAKRNTASTIVPTIAYQSLKAQMDVLLVRPFENLRRSKGCDISTFPYAILIDGLDECQGELSTTTDLGRVKTKYNAEDRQAELLAAIKDSLLDDNLPFRIFIASRPELPIHTALGPAGSLHGLAYHIQLSDQYDATEDMRRYLRRRFQDIGLRIRQPDWFTEGNIESLVQAGSGQFVLKTVLNWTADQGQVTKPFEALDMLYTNILLNAKEAYEAVDTHSGRDFLLLLNIFRMHSVRSFQLPCSRNIVALIALLNLESSALEILTLDLRSLVYLEDDEDERLAAYHKSLYDFMAEESRAKDLYVSYSRICTHIAKCCMQYIIESPELHSLPDKGEDMSVSEKCLILAVAEVDCVVFAKFSIDDEIVDFTHHVIFLDERIASNWTQHLGDAANGLKRHRPEEEDGQLSTDASSGSDSEFSDSD